MTSPGHVIENPVTGERAVFPQATEQAPDDHLRFDLFVRPGGFVAGADEHLHPFQDEHFFVKAGTIRLRIGGEERHCTIGDTVTIPAGVPHVWWNAGPDEVHAVVELSGTSARRFEAFATSIFALAQAGKTDKKGNPNLLRAAVILREYRHVVCAVPLFVQRVLVPPLAFLGRLMGYRPDYPYHTASSQAVG